jgi:2'-5' RNA ligase
MDIRSTIQIPGYNYNEYLLVLNPHEDLRDKIMQVKKEFSEKYKATVSLYSKPHITLVNFVQFEMLEERLVNRLKIIAAGYHPFKVDLKDYGSFPSHTIFINVESKQQVQNLGKELRPAQQLMTLNKDNKPHFINDPHLTIARKLLPWQYEKGWLDYSHRYFTGSFMADGMLLLKRPLTSRSDRAGLIEKPRNYQIVQRFEFMNLPVNTKQGELFM